MGIPCPPSCVLHSFPAVIPFLLVVVALRVQPHSGVFPFWESTAASSAASGHRASDWDSLLHGCYVPWNDVMARWILGADQAAAERPHTGSCVSCGWGGMGSPILRNSLALSSPTSPEGTRERTGLQLSSFGYGSFDHFGAGCLAVGRTGAFEVHQAYDNASTPLLSHQLAPMTHFHLAEFLFRKVEVRHRLVIASSRTSCSLF
ncbi:hypothetical protein BDZ89DRAFT_1033351 [Hymenopellis radicata]|nr:hypothetical protein BDZ89DRAFT_1033351 [Hymenopellis radicata]